MRCLHFLADFERVAKHIVELLGRLSDADALGPIDALALTSECAELRDALQMALLQLQRFYRQIQKRVTANSVSAQPERPLGDAALPIPILHTSDAAVLHLRDPLADKFEHRWPVIARPPLFQQLKSEAASRARKSHSTSNGAPPLETLAQSGDGEQLNSARPMQRMFSVPSAQPRGSPPPANVAQSVDTALLNAHPDAASESSAPLPLILGAIDAGDLSLVQQLLQRGTSTSIQFTSSFLFIFLFE